MAGHSKWANIKHKKAHVDAKRGAAFTKIVRLIVAAVKKGGPDPDMNPSLRLAVEKARSANMPKDNIERAIKKAAGDGNANSFEELVYEGYGKAGVAIIVEALTDNKNRTTPEVRKIFEKANGNLGEMGCVNWMFKKMAVIHFETKGQSEDEIMEIALEIGADDVESGDGMAEIKADSDSMIPLMDELRNKGFEPSGDVQNIPDTPMEVNVEDAKKVMTLMERLEEHEDVQSVFSSMVLSPEVEEQLMAEES
jgi:YebC/PmpR family DNA-binding regulatory protein